MATKKYLDLGGLTQYDTKIKSVIPSKTSDLTNDSGFIDNTYHDSLKQNTLVSGTNIKTINNQSILGNGDISFETIQEISGESSIRIKNLDTGIYRIYGGAYGCDVYYNSTGSLFIPSSYAYLIVTVEDDLQTVRHWVCIGNEPNEVCYGYSWLSYGYCYNVTSAEEQAAITGILSNLTTTAKTNLVSAINELDSDKQDTLVSGTNIKTINNQSILGSGNISISGGLTIDDIYPVGSIYMSVNAVNPSTLFGGTWEQIKDKFLLSAGDTYNNGDEGGEATHKLTTSELPSHAHKHNPNDDTAVGMSFKTGTGNKSYRIGSQSSGQYVFSAGSSASLEWATSGTAYTGGGEAHNNMPPYLVVNVWKRTA